MMWFLTFLFYFLAFLLWVLAERPGYVMNIPDMFEATACLILGCMFTLVAYIQNQFEKLKEPDSKKN